MNKEEILNSNCDVRRYAAGNPNTPADVLTELAKDSEWYVRGYAEKNINHKNHLLLQIHTLLYKVPITCGTSTTIQMLSLSTLAVVSVVQEISC